MTLLELKKELHDKIDRLNDESYLEILNNMLAHKKDVFVIPERMKEGIRQGTKDIKDGNFLTIEELEKKYEKWLKG